MILCKKRPLYCLSGSEIGKNRETDQVDWLKNSLLSNYQSLSRTVKVPLSPLEMKKKTNGLNRTRSPPPNIGSKESNNLSQRTNYKDGRALYLNRQQIDEDLVDFLKMNNEDFKTSFGDQMDLLKVPPHTKTADLSPQNRGNQSQQTISREITRESQNTRESQPKMSQTDGRLPKIPNKFSQVKRNPADVRVNASPKTQPEMNESVNINMKKNVKKPILGSKT